MRPATVPLTAWRNARFAEERHFTESDQPLDFTSYSDARLEVRQFGAQAGAAAISLDKVVTNIEGVRFLEPAHGVLRIQIDQATLEAAYDALFGTNEAGSALKLVYDLVLTGPDGADEIWMQGDFTLNPGVSIDG